jgi:hypothetical protein
VVILRGAYRVVRSGLRGDGIVEVGLGEFCDAVGGASPGKASVLRMRCALPLLDALSLSAWHCIYVSPPQCPISVGSIISATLYYATRPSTGSVTTVLEFQSLAASVLRRMTTMSRPAKRANKATTPPLIARDEAAPVGRTGVSVPVELPLGSFGIPPRGASGTVLSLVAAASLRKASSVFGPAKLSDVLGEEIYTRMIELHLRRVDHSNHTSGTMRAR